MKYKITTRNHYQTMEVTDEKKARSLAMALVLQGRAEKAYVTEYIGGKPTGRWTRVQPGVIINNY